MQSEDHEISEHDKNSAEDSNEDNCDGFYEFVKMTEQDNEVSGSFIGQGDSENQELGDKITFYPKISCEQPKFEEQK